MSPPTQVPILVVPSPSMRRHLTSKVPRANTIRTQVVQPCQDFFGQNAPDFGYNVKESSESHPPDSIMRSEGPLGSIDTNLLTSPTSPTRGVSAIATNSRQSTSVRDDCAQPLPCIALPSVPAIPSSSISPISPTNGPSDPPRFLFSDLSSSSSSPTLSKKWKAGAPIRNKANKVRVPQLHIAPGDLWDMVCLSKGSHNNNGGGCGVPSTTNISSSSTTMNATSLNKDLPEFGVPPGLSRTFSNSRPQAITPQHQDENRLAPISSTSEPHLLPTLTSALPSVSQLFQSITMPPTVPSSLASPSVFVASQGPTRPLLPHRSISSSFYLNLQTQAQLVQRQHDHIGKWISRLKQNPHAPKIPSLFSPLREGCPSMTWEVALGTHKSPSPLRSSMLGMKTNRAGDFSVDDLDLMRVKSSSKFRKQLWRYGVIPELRLNTGSSLSSANAIAVAFGGEPLCPKRWSCEAQFLGGRARYYSYMDYLTHGTKHCSICSRDTFRTRLLLVRALRWMDWKRKLGKLKRRQHEAEVFRALQDEGAVSEFRLHSGSAPIPSHYGIDNKLRRKLQERIATDQDDLMFLSDDDSESDESDISLTDEDEEMEGYEDDDPYYHDNSLWGADEDSVEDQGQVVETRKTLDVELQDAQASYIDMTEPQIQIPESPLVHDLGDLNCLPRRHLRVVNLPPPPANDADDDVDMDTDMAVGVNSIIKLITEDEEEDFQKFKYATDTQPQNKNKEKHYDTDMKDVESVQVLNPTPVE
ncbi:hypothetical protein BDN72DRAFT_556718 [Pluteus cervinus]|uniref:Uncharacterized protein n=1 Tax=Pluteus cervinus TaxID=181527 RepID=A0ACD3BB52_9AGAR|nr:hypothetical protein BDN72DRAFT_556718 [Pluteus cervinus]